MQRRAALVVVACCAHAASAQWTFRVLHPGGAQESAVNGVAAGQQAGYARLGPTVGDTRASVWSGTAASWVNLHPAAAVYSRCYAAGGGQQVGEVFIANQNHASLWTGTAASWIDLHPTGATTSIAYGAAGGQQVGYAAIPAVAHAMLWSGSAGTMVDLNPAPVGGFEFRSEAYCTDGTRQGGYAEGPDGIHAAVWNGSPAWVDLHPPGNISSWVYGISGSQQVGVVRVPNSSSHAALWSGTAASWVDLHPAGATSSYAAGVAGGRQVGYVVQNGTHHAALWSGSAASLVDLHTFLPASYLTSDATGIWSDGANFVISGYAYNIATTRQEAVLWTLCYADCNGDGGVSLSDFGCFQTRFALGNAYADCNGDGVLNLSDFGCFTTRFALGCP